MTAFETLQLTQLLVLLPFPLFILLWSLLHLIRRSLETGNRARVYLFSAVYTAAAALWLFLVGKASRYADGSLILDSKAHFNLLFTYALGFLLMYTIARVTVKAEGAPPRPAKDLTLSAVVLLVFLLESGYTFYLLFRT